MQGYHGLVKTLVDNIYYYQDELGSTSHVADANGALLEYYKYDLYGKPTYFDANGNQLTTSTSNYSVEVLGNGGSRWMPETGLYDDRNRFMSPDIGRFLQPDPSGFKGDASNLYRYCANDWANRTDPMGLQDISQNIINEEIMNGFGAITIGTQSYALQKVQQAQKSQQSQNPQQRFRMRGPHDQTKDPGPAIGTMPKSADHETPQQLGQQGVKWAEEMFKKTHGDLYGYNFYRMDGSLVWGRSWPGSSGGAVPQDTEPYPWPVNGNGSFAAFVANGHLHLKPDQDHPNRGTGFSGLDERLSRGLIPGHEGAGTGPVLKRSNFNSNYYDEIDNGVRRVIDEEGNVVHRP